MSNTVSSNLTNEDLNGGMFEFESSNQTEMGNFDISIFEIDQEKGLVNLTKIAEHFSKKVFDWKRLPATQRFLTAFFRKNPERENLATVQGGNKQGTWASRKIALKFAEWISVDFEIYCNEKLDELFQTGKTELKAHTPNTAAFWLDLQNKQQEAIGYLQNSLSDAKKQLEKAKPAIEFTEQVNNTKKAITVQDFSNLLPDTGRTRLFKWFKEKGYLINTTTPHQKYKEKGYFRVVERVVEDSKGEPLLYKVVLITGKGQVFFTKKFLDEKKKVLTLHKKCVILLLHKYNKLTCIIKSVQ